MRNFTLCLLFFLVLSCSAIRVDYDYDDKIDFTSYTTYKYYDNIDTGLNDFDQRRLFNAIDAVLGEKGFKFSEEPDVYVNIQSVVFPSGAGNNVGLGIGGGSRTVGGGVSIGIPVGAPKMTRELQVDLIDANKDVLIWQAISESPFKEQDTPKEKEEKLKMIVSKIFSKYPPN